MFVVYAIYNKLSRKMYVGYTKDLKDRIAQHNKGFPGSFTSRFGGAWDVIYSEDCCDRTSAIYREKQLKSFRGREFLKKYIPG